MPHSFIYKREVTRVACPAFSAHIPERIPQAINFTVIVCLATAGGFRRMTVIPYRKERREDLRLQRIKKSS